MHTPFSRYASIRALIMMALALPLTERFAALARVPEYRSRGKGRTRTWATSNPITHCNNARVSPGTQGARERARRVKQMNKPQTALYYQGVRIEFDQVLAGLE